MNASLEEMIMREINAMAPITFNQLVLSVNAQCAEEHSSFMFSQVVTQLIVEKVLAIDPSGAIDTYGRVME